MPQVNCPRCGQLYDIPPEQWGQYQGGGIQCTRCGQAFPVGGPPAGAGIVPLPPPVAGGAFPGGPVGPYGVLPGPYGMPPAPRRGISGWVIALIVLGCVFVGGSLLVAILLPSLNRAREAANRVRCAANLRQVAQGYIMYHANFRAVPDRLDRLVSTGLLSEGQVFVCPSSTDEPSRAATPAQLADDLNGSGHLSYVYVGHQLPAPGSANGVIAYEPLADHRGEGVNVAFGDGSVQFVPKAKAAQMIAELERGQNPPPSMAGR